MAGAAFFTVAMRDTPEKRLNEASYVFFKNADKKGLSYVKVGDIVQEFAGHGIEMPEAEIEAVYFV